MKEANGHKAAPEAVYTEYLTFGLYGERYGGSVSCVTEQGGRAVGPISIRRRHTERRDDDAARL